jgi:hypothetical protein
MATDKSQAGHTQRAESGVRCGKRPVEGSAPDRASPPLALRSAQQVLGNQGVLRRLQAKLTVHQPGDVYEQEADRVADAVVSQTGSRPALAHPILSTKTPATVQRKCAACEEEDMPAEVVQLSGTQNTTAPTRSAEPKSSAGAALPDSLQTLMEQRFGGDFSEVRIHTDEAAKRASADLTALAFTKGRDIYFADGQYQPHSSAGLRLLAHELTHVAQQRNGLFPLAESTARPAFTRDQLEKEADRAAAAVSSNLDLEVRGRTTGEEVHTTLAGDLVEFRRRLSSGIDAVADFLAAREAATDPLIARIAALRSRIRRLTSIRLPRDLIVGMEALNAQLRSVAPSWLPLPNISFAGTPVQTVALVDDVAIGAVILFLAFCLMMVWLMGRLNPTVRRQQDEAIRRIVEGIEDGLRPAPAPPTPVTGPTSTTQAPPVTTAPPVTLAPPTVDTSPPTDIDTGPLLSQATGNKIRGLAVQVVIHLARILGTAVAGMPPDHQNDPEKDRPHWWKEIKNFVQQILNLKLTPKQLMRELLKRFTPEDIAAIKEAMKRAAEKLGEDPPDFPPTATP